MLLLSTPNINFLPLPAISIRTHRQTLLGCLLCVLSPSIMAARGAARGRASSARASRGTTHATVGERRTRQHNQGRSRYNPDLYLRLTSAAMLRVMFLHPNKNQMMQSLRLRLYIVT
jgi:hypothetical protein